MESGPFTELPSEIGEEAWFPLAVGAQMTVHDLMGFEVSNLRAQGTFIWENNIVCFAAIDVANRRIWIKPQNNEDTYSFAGSWDPGDSGQSQENGVIRVTWTAAA